jgi:spermidine synthase
MRWPAALWWLACWRAGRRRPPHHLAEDKLLRRPHRLQQSSALPAHRGHPGARRAPAVPQRQPAVCRARRIPLPRGPGAPGMAAHGAPRKRVRCWAAATAWRCARSSSTPRVEQVTLVELDPAMTRCSPAPQRWRAERRRAASPQGAASSTPTPSTWLEDTAHATVLRRDRGRLPRPDQLLHRQALHHQLLRQLLDQRLAASGYAVVQTTSPLVARQSFWTVVQTIESVGLRAPRPTTRMCPASANGASSSPAAGPGACPTALPEGLRFLTPKACRCC